MNELALFAGAGGGILGGKLLGWRTVCAVEYEPHAAAILIQRQNDGILQPFPVWDDVRTFDGKPWRGVVDVVSGGFPCQDISCAGKGKGLAGERSGLWGQMARIVSEIRPEYVFVENSPIITIRGLGVVLGQLAEMGYNARWGVLAASHTGAPHDRKRMWVVAYTSKNKQFRKFFIQDFNSKKARERQKEWGKNWNGFKMGRKDNSFFMPEKLYNTNTPRMVDGLADRLDRVARAGNGQVPAVVKLAWETLAN